VSGIEVTAFPLAFIAGILGILSPCVWPLVPVVMSSASGGSSLRAPLALASGLSLSFALAGTLLTFVLLNLGLGLESLRILAAGLLVFVGVTLVSRRAGEAVAAFLARLLPISDTGSFNASSPAAQFAVGAVVGLVWLPCVGPTLGAAIALASLGREMIAAFFVMLAFGAGTALALLVAAFGSQEALRRLRPGILSSATRGKALLGFVLLALGLLVLTGWDKRLEAWSLTWLPDWAITL
jgi:cytochrome c-type biogenesis protein